MKPPRPILFLKARVKGHTRWRNGKPIYVSPYTNKVPPAEPDAPTRADKRQPSLFDAAANPRKSQALPAPPADLEADTGNGSNSSDLAADPLAAEPPMPADMPPGATWSRGKGALNRGHYAVQDAAGERIGNFHPTPEAAAQDARQWLSNRAAYTQDREDQAAREARIVAKLRGGTALTDADLKTLNLRTPSRFDYLSPVVQRLFGIGPRQVRAAIGPGLRKVPNGMNTAVHEVADPRKALIHAAAYAAGGAP